MPENQADELPESLRSWVEQRATASDADPTEIIARAVTVYKLVEEHSTQEGEAGLSGVEVVGERLGELESTSEQLTARVAGVEDDLDEMITDVRNRVIQVKRETDEKAPVDHDHPALTDRLESVETMVDETEATVEEVQQTVDTGFENFEEILTYLADETEELDEKFQTLASAVDDARKRIGELEHQVERQRALDDLKRSANRQGISKGKCSSCGNPVTVGLLTEPNCPHCEEVFTDIDPPGRFFGAATLNTGQFPALTADTPPDETRTSAGTDESVPETVSELFEETKESRDD